MREFNTNDVQAKYKPTKNLACAVESVGGGGGECTVPLHSTQP
jgi:hypothetical protein